RYLGCRENFARLALELRHVARVARGNVSEHELADTGGHRDLCGFAGGRMPCLRGAGGFLVGERRLVNEEIGAGRRLHRGLARPRIPRDHELSARPCGSDEIRGIDLAAVVQRDAMTAMESPPQGTFRYAKLARALGIEPAETRGLHQREAECR